MPGLTTFSRRSFLIMPLALAACKPGADVLEIAGTTMGTTYSLVAVGAAGREVEVRAAVDSALAQTNAQMSNWDEGSEISRFNAQASLEAVRMSGDLAHVMQAAQDVHLASEGRFDTTIGPLIELWGFGANEARKETPGRADLAAAAERAGHGNTLEISATSLRKTRGDAQVYLAAIGKGYGADKVGAALAGLGITDYMIEIGGDLYAAGLNPQGMPWQIGVETPDAASRGVMQVVGVSNRGLASSGDYRNYFEEDGQRYSHVIDPTTGSPITHRTASATVMAENAMLADAWATAMLILGREKGLEIAERHDIAVMFVDRDTSSTDLRFKTYESSAFTA